MRSQNSATLAFVLALFMAAMPLVNAHQGSLKRFDPEGDLEVGVRRGHNTPDVYAGAPCERTDLRWADVEAFHEDEAGEVYNGTRVTMRIADLDASCPLENHGGPYTRFYYGIEFRPENHDWFQAWIEVTQSGELGHLYLQWYVGGSRWGTGCQGCGAEVDVANDTVTFEIPTWLAVPPYEEAVVFAQMTDCLYQDTACTAGQPPSVSQQGDMMPNVGTYCFFCDQEAH